MKFRALIIGTAAYELAFAPLPILHRAGFQIDYIFLGDIDFGVYEVNRLPIINDSLIETVVKFIGIYKYDLIIIADEDSISSILESNLPEDIKLKLLPVTNASNFEHLASKCGLSEVLASNNISTPPFFVCNSQEEIRDAIDALGLPIFIKIDKSSGGGGVFECSSMEDALLVSHGLPFPLLVQKKILGKVIDQSAFYQNGKLVHFTYSTFLKTINGMYGPSSVREYFQNGTLADEVVIQMQDLGAALGADGFVNVSCIECSLTNKRYIFEADMRPNTWVDYGKFIGNDAATSIRNYFSNNHCLELPIGIANKYPLKLVLSYPGRLNFYELITNKYNCWKIFNSLPEYFSYVLYRIRIDPSNLMPRVRRPILIGKFRHHSLASFKLNCFQHLPYQADLRLLLFFNIKLKPLLPPAVWNFFVTIYRGSKY